MSIEKLTNEEILTRLTDLEKLQVESTEYKTGVESVTKLMGALVEMKKADAAITDQEKARILEEETRELDNKLKVKQAKAENFDKIARNIITATVGLGGLCVTVWGTCKSLKFEETGVCTSTASKKFFANALNYFKK